MRLLEVLLGSDNTAILVLLSARLMDAALHDAAQYEFLKKLTALFGGLVNLVCSVADSYRNVRAFLVLLTFRCSSREPSND